MNPGEVATFERFMDFALHDPRRGYYARRIQGIGGRGDFTTAPMLSESLGRAVASWAAKSLRETGCRNLIEIGPGEGRLAASVWRHLPWLLRRRTRLHLVERSAPLAEAQRKLLGNRARWHEEIGSALTDCDGAAVIFSNELVDAFPVRLFQRAADRWLEIGVRFEGGAFRETALEATELPPSSIFGMPFPPGQRVEVHDSYRRWLAGWMPQWCVGRLLTIDYGAPAEDLYHRNPGGSLRAYLLHQRLTGPDLYLNVGRQDITADVNFTDLQSWSSTWTTGHRLLTFADFVKPFATAPDAQLLAGDGAGTAFMVLEQRAGSDTA